MKNQIKLTLLCTAGLIFSSAQILNAEEKVATENMAYVTYGDFGAKGDGKTDDMNAIVNAHNYANEHGLPVKADDNATYYIGGLGNAIIKTDTDFGTAKFIIDDTNIKKYKTNIFYVKSNQKIIYIKDILSLKKNQSKINVSLPKSCIVKVENNNKKNYIRYGANQNSGHIQTDVFIVDKNGNVDDSTPIIWDFDKITRCIAYPIDETQLKITGGYFTTIANTNESKYTYFDRGIRIERSNVVVDRLEHHITGEGDHGAPYGGFISIRNCADVTVQNSIFSGHKIYTTIGTAGRPVSMGSYDITAGRAINISFVNCKQADDIKDRKHWGIMGSNYCKNLLLDGCSFSRFDAHMGVCNATIINSTIGYVGINAIGHGTLTVENTTVYGRNFINLRSDYGSSWQGDIIIRNCKFIPNCGKPGNPNLISGSYSGQHDFGYTCYMPETITIENLYIDDSNHSKNYSGPTIFSNFNKHFKTNDYIEKFPYVKTKEVILKNVTTASGKPLRLSDNKFMFKDVKVISIDKETKK
jgi:hypothetical protein